MLRSCLLRKTSGEAAGTMSWSHTTQYATSLIAVYSFLLSFDRPKHPYEGHVWARISLRGRTGICILTGTMDYTKVHNKEVIGNTRQLIDNSSKLGLNNETIPTVYNDAAVCMSGQWRQHMKPKELQTPLG